MKMSLSPVPFLSTEEALPSSSPTPHIDAVMKETEAQGKGGAGEKVKEITLPLCPSCGGYCGAHLFSLAKIMAEVAVEKGMAEIARKEGN